MKSVRFLFFILLFGPSIPAFSNPIIPGPMIFEIYFGPDGWQIEMKKSNSSYWEVNLDHVWMISDADAAHFKPGISFAYNETIVVTQDDFITEFYINQAADWLTLMHIDGEINEVIDYFGLAWGEIIDPTPYNYVTPPAGEQSIALQKVVENYSNEWYWAVKEQPNTMGYSTETVYKRAQFSGHVRDMNDDPMEGIVLDYCGTIYSPGVPFIITDSNGFFYTDNMFCREYPVIFKYNGVTIVDSSFNIEPDSANYYEFKLDTLLTAIHEIKQVIPGFSVINIPNPASTLTTFVIESNNQNPGQKGVIKIYSDIGYIVDIVPVVINAEKQEIVYNFKDKALSPGMYFYNLEIRNHKAASGKMIISL